MVQKVILIILILFIGVLFWWSFNATTRHPHGHATRALFYRLEMGLNKYYSEHGKFPDAIAEGDEDITSKLPTKYGSSKLFEELVKGGYVEVDDRFMKILPTGNLIFDATGNEIFYIPANDYDTALHKGKRLAIKHEKGYYNSSTFVLRSFGNNGIDDDGRRDDVQNFSVE